MSDEIRQTQEIVEIGGPQQVEVRESQETVEVAGFLQIEVKSSQEAVEVAGPIQTEVRQAQNIVEVLWIPADLSGIYWINPVKTHDSYYLSTEVKIPDPVVRLALVGE